MADTESLNTDHAAGGGDEVNEDMESNPKALPWWWPEVNWPLVPVKVTFFMNWFTLACVSPVLSVYLSDRGLGPAEVGMIASLQPLAGAVGSPMWAAVADIFNIHKYVLMFCFVFSITLRSLVILAPNAWLMGLVIVCTDMIGSGVGPLIDYSALQALAGRRGDYGKQRLWGAVGWGVSAPIIGAIVQFTNDKNYYYYCQLISLGLSIFPLLRLPFQPRRDGEQKPPLLKAMAGLMKQPEVVTFFIVMFLMGILMGQITTFLFVWLDELGGDPSLYGLTLTVTCISEVPFFFFAGRLIKAMGNHVVLHIGLFTYILRFVYYSYMEDPWMVLPAEILHGLTYAASWAAGTDYAASIAPPGLAASMQGLLQGVHWGFGTGVGALVGGFVYAEYGGRISFRIFAGVAALAHVILLLSQWFKHRGNNNNTQSQDATPFPFSTAGSYRVLSVEGSGLDEINADVVFEDSEKTAIDIKN